MDQFTIMWGSHEPEYDDFILVYDKEYNGSVIARGFITGIDYDEERYWPDYEEESEEELLSRRGIRWRDCYDEDEEPDDAGNVFYRRVIVGLTLSDGVPLRETHYKIGSASWAIRVEGSRDPLRAYYVNVYKYDMAYGGPEEGGWYYSTGCPVDCYRFSTWSAADAWRREEGEKLLDTLNEGRRPVSSVLSDGRYCLKLETHRGKAYPSSRPYYS